MNEFARFLDVVVSTVVCAALTFAACVGAIYGARRILDTAIKHSMRKKVEQRMLSEYENNWDDFRYWLATHRDRNIQCAEEKRPDAADDRLNVDLRAELEHRKQLLDSRIDCGGHFARNKPRNEFLRGRISAQTDERNWLREVLKDG